MKVVFHGISHLARAKFHLVMASYSLERENYVLYFARKSTSNLGSLLIYIQFCDFKDFNQLSHNTK
jgi:hypothetical protein